MQPGHSSVLQESSGFSLGFGFRLKLVGLGWGIPFFFPGSGFGGVRVEGLVRDILLEFLCLVPLYADKG